MANTGWSSTSTIEKRQYRCGHCEHSIASQRGWRREEDGSLIHLCPNCDMPTITFADGRIWPMKSAADQVPSLAEKIGGEDLAVLYEEVRETSKAGAYTAAELLAYALIERIGVQDGGDEDLGLVEHVLRLMEVGRIPQLHDDIVDLMRRRFSVPPYRLGPLDRRQAGLATHILEELAGIRRD